MKNKQKQPNMKCMNVMQCNANPWNKGKQKHKENGHKELWDEAQEPCQKDSIELSLLHP